MNGFALFGLVLGVTALLAWINERWLKLPTAIGVMAGGLATIPLVLVVRFVSVGVPIALALALPASPHRDVVLSVTYAVVVFSVLVQGLTVGNAVRRALG